MPDGPDKPWFAPKRYGLGASFPIAWQGWAAAAALIVALLAARFWLAGALRATAMAAVIAAFVAVAALKTEGGWRWRWGGK